MWVATALTFASWSLITTAVTLSPPIEPDPVDDLMVLLAQIDETGLIPVGNNGEGIAPFGYIEAEPFLEAGDTPHGPVPVFDDQGDHVGYFVPGQPPLTINEYESSVSPSR